MNPLYDFIHSPKQILKNFGLIILLPAFMMLSNSLMGQVTSAEDFCQDLVFYEIFGSNYGCNDEWIIQADEPNYCNVVLNYKTGNFISIKELFGFSDIFNEYPLQPSSYTISLYGFSCEQDSLITFPPFDIDLNPADTVLFSLDTVLTDAAYSEICIEGFSIEFMRNGPLVTIDGDTVPNALILFEPIVNDSCVLGGSIQFDTLNQYIDLNGVICNNADPFELGLKNLYTGIPLDDTDISESCFTQKAFNNNQINWYYQNLGENEKEIEADADGKFMLDPSNLKLGTQQVICKVTPPNIGGSSCGRITLSRTIQVTEDPVVQFDDTNLTVVAPPNYVFSLKEYLTSTSTTNGTPLVKWVACDPLVDCDPSNVLTSLCPQDSCTNDFTSMPDAGTFAVPYEGLFVFKYTANDPGNCVDPNPFDTLPVYFINGPSVDFTVSGFQTCSPDTFSITVELEEKTVESTYQIKIVISEKDSLGLLLETVDNTYSFGNNQSITIPMEAIPQGEEYTYDITVIGTRPAPLIDTLFYVDSAGNKVNTVSTYGPFGVQSDTLEDSSTQTFTSYNDDAECKCIINEFDVCEISTNDYFNISCSFIDINLFRVLGPNSLVASQQHVDCSQSVVTLDSYETKFLGLETNGPVGGKQIQQLPGADIICDVFAFCICIDWLGIHIRPFHSLYEALRCGDTVSEVVFEMLGAVLDGDGGGGQIVADTNGDGTFDYLVAEGKMPLNSDSPVTIPQRVGNNGVLTVRMVEGWPNTTTGTCGDVTVPGMELFDLLPIGAIPVVGIIIEEILEAAGCGSNLSWSTYEDLKYYVKNENPPIFTDCPNGQTIKISEDYSCDLNVNWNFPTAIDGCYNSAIEQYMADTDIVSLDSFNNFVMNQDSTMGFMNEEGIWRVDDSSEYQMLNPQMTNPPSLINSGDEIPTGLYPVKYYAQNCNKVGVTCEFYIEVGPGDPILLLPEDLTVPMDIDSNTAIVSGLAPITGSGCGTTIKHYCLNGTDTLYNGWGDISGKEFDKGTNEIVYRMKYKEPSISDSIIVWDTFYLHIEDQQNPTAICQDVPVQLMSNGTISVPAIDVDAGSFDNDTLNSQLTLFRKTNEQSYSSTLEFDCMEIGANIVELKVVDISGNESTCLATIFVENFFEGFELTMDLPELCFEANNPIQFDFTNYLQIQNPNNGGAVLAHQDVSTLGSDVGGFFALTSFVPNLNAPNAANPQVGTSPDNPGDVGYIDLETGMYTPGTGSGYVTVTYLLTNTNPGMIQQNASIIEGCYKMVHETFELRQPVTLDDDMECLCGDFTSRSVDLGNATGGLEPYTIQYSGATLDYDGDGLVDDSDGTHTYNNDLSDFTEDLGMLLVDYTTPVWSITIVDARGCEVFRSGSCDIIDASQAPTITCPDNVGPVYTDSYVCSTLVEWNHPDIISGMLYDNCVVHKYNYYVEYADLTTEGPLDLSPLLNIDNSGNTAIDTSLFNAAKSFPLGVSTVNYYAADATGNFIECSFTVTVEDNLPPVFINCPVPPVVQNTETDHCDAYVNFALPLAEDNCDVPTVVQIDNTGLSTGDRFPAGTTIMYWEATDLSGNKDTCEVKVIVNDYWNVPEINCPADVLQTTDDWRCDAVVYNIGADISSVCQDNLSLTYEIFADEALTDRIRCGVGDASGEIFDKGDTWVKYNVRSQPLLLISEISQGTTTDQLEIVNLGAATIDISCLEVLRSSSADPSITESLPMVTNFPVLTPTVLASGDVMVFDFSFDAAESTPACYTIQYMGNIIDQVAVNGANSCNGFTGVLSSGNVYRHCEADTDDAADWAVEENCSLLTIGLLNPTLDAMADNGTTTSLQSVEASSASCSFQVTILDDENPFCGELDPNTNAYTGAGLTNVDEDQCNQSTIEITDACIIGQMSLDLSGTVDVSNADITLISPAGDRIPILSLPYDLFNDLYTIKSEGEWTLDIAPNTSGSFTLDAWSLEITCMNPYEMDDVVLSNDPGVCGAQLDWIHPWMVDNCKEGSISVEYLSDDAACTPEDGQLTAFGGYDVSAFFCVGTTTVRYTLVDEAGNDHQCSFDVTVNDTEAPVIECPADMVFNLDGGLCDIAVCYDPLSAVDNCAVTDTIFSIEPCTAFDIGLHTVDITIQDEAGNSDMCSFTIEVIEYVPSPYVMVCNNLVNVSLGSDCLEELNADMLLEGDNYHCYDDYQITITNMLGYPIPNSPLVDINDAGENFLVMVLDPDSGNFCWSQIHVQDYNDPIIECPADITVKCFDPTDESNTGSAILTSCEASIEWIVNDVVTDLDECDHVISELTRTFTAIDESGNSSSCSHTISIERILLEDVDFPANLDGFANPAITCGDLNSNPELTDPSAAGTPTAFGSTFDQEASCGLSIVMEDLVFNLCGGTYDILRLWSVYDPCLPAQIGINPIQHLQVIKVKDQAGASITCPADVSISVDAGIGCNTNYVIPPATITDACSDYEVITSTIFGSMYSNGGLITDIPRGTFEVNYQVIDDCGNTSSCEYNLEVIDAVTPDMVCIQFKEVVLNSAGTATVDFDVFDNGSHDNCCLEMLEVARMDDQVFSETVSFDCSDDVVMVILRGTDCFGNTNQCMTEVDVEDKLGPNLLCPDNTSIDCNVYFEELGAALDLATEQMAQDPDLAAAEAFAFLDNYGPAMVIDNCGASIDLTVTYTVDQCGEGAITRTWTAADEAGNEALPCAQTISIEHQSSWMVNFPEDWTGELEADCSVPDPQFGEAVISEDDCEMVAVSYTDDYYYTTNIGCYKIIRTWTAINWCTYSGTSQENAVLVSAGDNIYSVSGDDYVTHVQTLDIYDTQAPVIEETGDIVLEVLVGCDLDVTIPAPTVLGECSTYDYQVTSTDLAAFGSNGVYAEVPLGTYSVTYEVNDDCGNISYWTTDVVLTDGKKPTPYCIDELVVEIMPDGNGGGMASVNATDFNFGSFDNCTDADQLQFSLSADITQTTQDFDCSQIGVQTIELHVWDEAGNTDFCVVALDVQDNMNACSTGSLTVAGALNTEDDEAIEFATVSINGGLFTYETGVDGAFVFDALETGEDYTIAPTLDLDPTNGVSTLDIVFITKHILGMDLLDSPYQLIAADANNSGTISTLDLVAIRKLILTLNLNFPNNQSWRFIDADYVFPDPTNPWATGFPEVISINNIDSDQDVNFIGIKIGDVNGSAQSHSFMPAEDRDENHPFIIQTEDQDLIPGQTYRVSLSANQASLGFQFTLNFDEQALRLVETYYSILNEEHIGLTNLSYGAITASWNDAEERLFDQDELITFEFEALKAGKLSELISLNSRITAAEAYSNTYPIQSVELWIGEQANQRMELYQNVPNPFSKMTRIPFFLPEDAEIKLSVRHINGQLVKSIEGNYEKGNNDIILQNIPRGIYYYTLEVDRYLITKKMVRL